MNIQLSLDSIVVHAGEPRVLDTDLARWLDLSRSTNIRTTISANRTELEGHGPLHCQRVKTGGRPAHVYMLNESQALVLCMLSKTRKATMVRTALVKMFAAYRDSKTVAVQSHYRSPPMRKDTFETAFQRNMGMLMAFRDDEYAFFELLAGTMAKVDLLDRA